MQHKAPRRAGLGEGERGLVRAVAVGDGDALLAPCRAVVADGGRTDACFIGQGRVIDVALVRVQQPKHLLTRARLRQRRVIVCDRRVILRHITARRVILCDDDAGG